MCPPHIDNSQKRQPPPAEGMRLEWEAVPLQTRAAIEGWIGSPVVSAESQRTGFSPGVAARVRAADNRRFFLKVAGPQPNPDVPTLHRREGIITSMLPAEAPVPRLLWSYDDLDNGWVALVYEEIDGRTPSQPWQADELERVMGAIVTLNEALTPSPLPAGTTHTASHAFSTRMYGWQKYQNDPTARSQLDSWSRRYLDRLAVLETQAGVAVSGDTLLHFDIRADNILLTPDRVWIVDWPLACVGAAWVDVVFFAPSVGMQGGPTPEAVIMQHPACQKADPDALTAAVAAIAGFFSYQSLRPAPPGLPTLRPFQAAQGEVARQWVAARTGWQ